MRSRSRLGILESGNGVPATSLPSSLTNPHNFMVAGSAYFRRRCHPGFGPWPWQCWALRLARPSQCQPPCHRPCQALCQSRSRLGDPGSCLFHENNSQGPRRGGYASQRARAQGVWFVGQGLIVTYTPGPCMRACISHPHMRARAFELTALHLRARLRAACRCTQHRHPPASPTSASIISINSLSCPRLSSGCGPTSQTGAQHTCSSPVPLYLGDQ